MQWPANNTDKEMPKEPKKTKKTTSKKTAAKTPPPLDIGLPKSGLISSKKAMDIVPKNKTMPSSSARPIIVSNRTVVKDPMAPSEDGEASDEKMQAFSTKANSKLVIAPLHKDIKPGSELVDVEAANNTASTAEPADTAFIDEPSSSIAAKTTEVKLSESASEAETTPDKKEEQGATVSSTGKSADKDEPDVAKKTEDFLHSSVDDTAEDIKKSTEPKPEEIERQKAEKRAEEAAELIASQQYFLPINAVKKRHFAHVSWLLLCILLALLVVCGLLDAGVLTFMTPPTDFMQN